MDDVTRQVSEMYTKFPYPSPQGHGRKLKELLNLLKLFSLENRYDFKGKRVLDAGTGTGHRLIEAARSFPQTHFVAVDISEVPLAIARQATTHEGVQNIDFRLCNIMEDDQILGTFEVILSMGVIHHLSNPAHGLRILTRHLSDDGMVFLYVYGKHGARERMRRKQIVSLLNGKDRQNFEQGIRLVKELGFDSFDYGWNLNFDDTESRDALIVDSYLNVNETLFDVDGLFDLMRESGLHSFSIYGLTFEKRGGLFDTRYARTMETIAGTLNVASHLGSPRLQEAYERLSLADKYRLMDVLFEPNGYTIVGFKAGALRSFMPESRVIANALMVADL
jgi:SAM-dependent methyltransferase